MCGVPGLAETFPSLTVSGTFLSDAQVFHVPPDRILPPQLWSSSRALPLHLHFDNCPDVLGFVSSFDVAKPIQPSPSHNGRYMFHLRFLQYLLIPPMYQQAHLIARRTICISVVAIRLSSLTDIGHVSQPYINVGRITIWYIRIFNSVGTFLSQITPLSSLHLERAIATLLSMSFLAPPLLPIVDPRYLKNWVVGKLTISVSMYLFILTGSVSSVVSFPYILSISLVLLPSYFYQDRTTPCRPRTALPRAFLHQSFP